MSHHPGRTRAVVTILVAAALVGLVAIGPLLVFPALIALVIYMARHAEDVDGARHSQALWLGVPIVGGDAVPRRSSLPTLLGGGDSAWWPLAVGAAIIGGPMLVISLVLNAVQRDRHPLRPPSAARPRAGFGRSGRRSRPGS